MQSKLMYSQSGLAWAIQASYQDMVMERDRELPKEMQHQSKHDHINHIRSTGEGSQVVEFHSVGISLRSKVVSKALCDTTSLAPLPWPAIRCGLRLVGHDGPILASQRVMRPHEMQGTPVVIRLWWTWLQKAVPGLPHDPCTFTSIGQHHLVRCTMAASHLPIC